METAPTVKRRLRAPLGVETCKIDSSGRVKLPAPYQEYLKELEDQYLFVTEVKGMARIFTNGSWERTVAKMEGDPDYKKRVTLLAEAIGCDVDVDPQGRVTLPQLLRKELKLEDQQVHMRFYEDVITIYTQEQFATEVGKAKERKLSDEDRMESMGINL